MAALNWRGSRCMAYLAVVQAPVGLDHAHRLIRDVAVAAAPPCFAHLGQDLPGGHRGDAGEGAVHGSAAEALCTQAGAAILLPPYPL